MNNASKSYYFYDLETSGFNPRTARIMQFAGQRTDMHLKPIGEPHNILIKLTEDILPDPQAIMVTGITPQQTVMEGITEVEFLKIFNNEIATPGTVFIGFNNLRFDDEFIRAINYRNFYDPYRWHWDESRSRWDLLDLVRMTRALRPEGIKWPTNEDGTPTNRLELVASENGLEHTKAHDALSDVLVTIKLAQMIKEKQPKLFDYLFQLSNKAAIQKLVNTGKPFIYTSGKYSNDTQKTTIVAKLADHLDKSGKVDGVLVYDLRVDPSQFSKLTVKELVEAWRWKDKEDKSVRLPVKTMKFNRCPAIAPLEVITKAKNSTEILDRLQLDMAKIEDNLTKLQKMSGFVDKINKAPEIMNSEQEQKFKESNKHVDEQIYEGFIGGTDSQIAKKIQTVEPSELSGLSKSFKDQRMKKLLPLYKARNFPSSLTSEEAENWQRYLKEQLMAGGQNSKLAEFFSKLEQVSEQSGLTKQQQSIIEDLDLYGQSLIFED